jgi:hypothetical protein
MTPVQGRIFGTAVQAATENKDKFGPSDFSEGFETRTTDWKDPYWEYSSLSSILPNWNKLFPYQLLLLKSDQTGKYSSDSILARFTLPIPPESMTVSMPFAINMAVTGGSILEEHNGVPMRTISLSGSTGVLPLRGSVATPNSFDSSAASILAGTVSAGRQISNAAATAFNLLGQLSAPVNVNSKTEMAESKGAYTLLESTGFAQIQLLQRFLEAYAQRKKVGEPNLRLAFASWKDGEVYLVTPVSFDRSRSANSPLEYRYSLSLKAWRRIVIQDGSPGAFVDNPVIQSRDPNRLAIINNTIEQSQRALEAVRGTLEGMRADIQNVVYTPVRELAVFVKDALGIAWTAADLPASIIRDLEEPILEAAGTAAGVRQLSGLPSQFGQTTSSAVAQLNSDFASWSVMSSKDQTVSGNTNNPRPRGSPANNALKNPGPYYDFFSTIKLGALNLRSSTRSKIEAERQRVRAFQRADFEERRAAIISTLADICDIVGAGDSTYNSTYGRAVSTTTRIPTDDEWSAIFNLSEIAQQFDYMACSYNVDYNQTTSMDYMAGLAAGSGIAFTVPRSKFAVPMPYGVTLEQLSTRYLGTPDRWLEIASLNGLESPYVDEVGFKLPFLVNGIGRTVLVSNSSNLFIGQRVWLVSAGQSREQRRIVDLSVGTTQTIVTLDGDEDLSKFAVVSGAYIQAFLPNTVNSLQQIYIPSDTDPAEEDWKTKSIPGLDEFDPIIKVGGVSLLLNDYNDIVIAPDGSTRLATGMTNITQKIRLALATRKGTLARHPDYGIGLKPGVSSADISAQDILARFQDFFKGDPSFTGISNVSIAKNANSVVARMTVGISGVSQYVPIQVGIVI